MSVKAWAIKGPDGKYRRISLLGETDAWLPLVSFSRTLPRLKAEGWSCVPVTITEDATDQREEAKPVAWTCFHCGEAFTDKSCAQDHFGRSEDSRPACQIKFGAERSMLSALRKAEDAATEAWHAAHNESTDAAKAYFAQASRHREQLQAAEELGYERGLSAAPPIAAGMVSVPIDTLQTVAITMRHAEVFIQSREKMHPTGQTLYRGVLESIEAMLAAVRP